MEVWNNRLLVQSESWDDVNKAAASVRALLMERLVRQHAIPATRGISYWIAVPRTFASSTLFYIQAAPILAARYFNQNHFTHIRYDKFRQSLARDLSRWKSFSVSDLFPFLVANFRAFCAAFGELARQISDKNIEKLDSERKEACEQIGRLLITESLKKHSNDMFVKGIVDATVSHTSSGTKTGSPDNGDNLVVSAEKVHTPADAMSVLQQILDNNNQPIKETIPSKIARWWPAAVLVVLGAFKVKGSWQQVVAWTQDSIISTMKSFWQLWVVEPLIEVFHTVRHDEAAQTSLIATESLSSDRDSLQRMVVDFAKAMNNKLTEMDLKLIGDSAAQGNVEPVMTVYEKQLEAPLSNIINGKLLRTFLIQVQKTKVDLEVALTGIDQLLASQQLVFGLIAAIPAFSVLWWISKAAVSVLYSRVYGMSASRAERNDIIENLHGLDLVIQSTNSSELSLEEIGMIYCRVTMIRDCIPKDRTPSSQLLRRSMELIVKHAVTRNSSAVLHDLDRTYSRYMATRLQE